MVDHEHHRTEQRRSEENTQRRYGRGGRQGGRDSQRGGQTGHRSEQGGGTGQRSSGSSEYGGQQATQQFGRPTSSQSDLQTSQGRGGQFQQSGGRTSSRTGDQTGGQTGGQMGGRTGGQASRQTTGQTGQQTGSGTSRQTGQMSGHQTGQMGGHRTGQMSSQQTGQMGSHQTGQMSGHQTGQTGGQQSQQRQTPITPVTVREIAATDVVTVQPDAPVTELVQQMASQDVGAVVVVQGNRPVGIVTDRKIALALGETQDVSRLQASDLMTEDLFTVSEDTSVFDLTRQLGGKGVRRVPIVGDQGDLRGIVSLDDVVVLLSEEFYNVSQIVRKQSPRF